VLLNIIMAERLTFLDGSISYASMLVSEHVSRYLLVKDICRGRRVLDIACGEGYGSSLLRSWGASEVIGVDISREAVENARKLFGNSDGISFVQHDATQCDELVDSLSQFDLIVCFETLEHVNDVARMLTGFRKLCHANGAIVISCPNDMAIIPSVPNEFHLKTYNFEEFQATVIPILGAADSWLLGTASIGFAVFDARSALLSPPKNGLLGLFDSSCVTNSQFVPTQTGHEVNKDNAAFYVASWGCILPTSSVAAPISFSSYESPWNNWVAAKNEIERISKDCMAAKNEVERVSRDFAASKDEIDRISRNLIAAKNEAERVSRDHAAAKNEIESLSRAESEGSRERAALKINLNHAQENVLQLTREYEAALEARDRLIYGLNSLKDESADQFKIIHDGLIENLKALTIDLNIARSRLDVVEQSRIYRIGVLYYRLYEVPGLRILLQFSRRVILRLRAMLR